MQHLRNSGAQTAGAGAPHADFSDFPARNLDVSRVTPPKSEAQGGIARLPEK